MPTPSQVSACEAMARIFASWSRRRKWQQHKWPLKHMGDGWMCAIDRNWRIRPTSFKFWNIKAPQHREVALCSSKWMKFIQTNTAKWHLFIPMFLWRFYRKLSSGCEINQLSNQNSLEVFLLEERAERKTSTVNWAQIPWIVNCDQKLVTVSGMDPSS